MDIIRVLRLVEYVGPRDLVEDQLTKSIHGKRVVSVKPGRNQVVIRAMTLGEVSEILGQEPDRVTTDGPFYPYGRQVIKDGIAGKIIVFQCDTPSESLALCQVLNEAYWTRGGHRA